MAENTKHILMLNLFLSDYLLECSCNIVDILQNCFLLQKFRFTEVALFVLPMCSEDLNGDFT